MASQTTPTPAPIATPRDLLSQYDLQEEIGRGDLARVYRARDRVLDHEVAVKLLHDRYGRDATTAARLYLTARAAASLGHPNIVAIYDHGPHDGTAFITMEAITGLDLAALLTKGGSLATRHALPLIARVLDALAAAHAFGIAHGDLHPRNIILRAGTVDGVVITDFGMAVARDRATTRAPGDADWTAPYRAPEHVPGDQASIAGDLYAVAVILHELLTGALPTAASLQRRPATIARPLFATLQQALATDPATRPASAPALRDALAGNGVTLPSTWVAAPAGPLEAAIRIAAPSPRPANRGPQRAAALLVAGALTLGGLVGAVALTQSSRTRPAPTPATTPAAIEDQPTPTDIPAAPTPADIEASAPTVGPAATAIPSPTLSPPAAALAPAPSTTPAVRLIQAPTPNVVPRPTPTIGTPRIVVNGGSGGSGGAVGVTLENFSPHLLQGAYQPSDVRRRAGGAVVLYGAGSGYNTGVLNFDVGLLPDGQFTLILTGLDDERDEHTALQLILNGTPLYTGPATLANRPTPTNRPNLDETTAAPPWDTMRLALPPGTLRLGPNTLIIRNTTPGTDLAAPYLLISNLEVTIETP